MARTTTVYSQAIHSVKVAAASGSFSKILRDFAEGDSIAFAPTVTDAVSVTDGFDQSKISVAASRSGKITIKLKPTSPSVGFLTNLALQNRTAPQIVNVTILTGVNETLQLENAGVNMSGGATGADKMSEREFSFIGTVFTPDISEG